MKYKVMLAQVGNEKDLEKKECLFEPKLEGIRALCTITADLQIVTSEGSDITAQFPELDLRHAMNAKSCIIDGEIVIYDEHGTINYKQLTGSDQLVSSLAIGMRVTQHPATFVAFDILEKNGKSLTDKPLFERKKILQDTIHPTKTVQVISVTDDGLALWEDIKARAMSGIIAKENSSIYMPGKKSKLWLIIKNKRT